MTISKASRLVCTAAAFAVAVSVLLSKSFAEGDSPRSPYAAAARGAMPPPTTRDPGPPDVLFAAAGKTRTTVLFNEGLRRIGEIQAPAGDFAVDRQGRLYDVPYNSTNVLESFAPPYNIPPARLRFGKDITVSLGVDTLNGVIAVGVEKYADGGPGPYVVEFFKPGTSKPCATVGSGSVAGIDFKMSFDRGGELFFVAALSGGGNAVASISGQCEAKEVQIYTLPSNWIYPFHTLFNSRDELVLQNLYSPQIYTFSHPIGTRFASPIATTTLKLPAGPPERAIFFQCFSSDGKHIWVNYGLSGSTKTLAEFRYPEGGYEVAHVDVSDAFACAVSPPVIP